MENDIKEEIKKSPNKTRIILFVTIGAVISGIIVVLVIYFIRNSLEEESKKELKFISWEEAHQKAEEKMKLFSIDEKLSILFGIQNMQKKPEDKGCVGAIEPIKEKFGGICLQDGPAGVRFSTSTQSWQAAINTVSTFNKSLMYEVGKAQGKEFREKGVNVALTPAMNIQRNPQGGRIWESFGDDPFLAGVAATQIIKGIQSNGVIACAKHYVGNDQETNRKNSSSNIKEQALWEIYLEPFIRSVQDAEVGAIMAAYNAINYTYVINNTRIVQNYLKEKIGYRGYVMSDWWAITSDDPNIFTSGIDMNMPGGKYEGDKSIGRNESFWSKFKDHLGNEIPMSLLPIYQKEMIKCARKHGKIAVVATEMLESMKKNARPTRAEVSDVTAAVFDGTDAVMLSGETTMGKYPEETVKYMAEICETAEKFYDNSFSHVKVNNLSEIVAKGAVECAKEEDIKLIVAHTYSGYTARQISNLKPTCPILATCGNEEVARSLCLNYGVYTSIIEPSNDMDDIVALCKKAAVEKFDLKEKDEIIVTAGINSKKAHPVTNFMKIEEI